MSKVVNYYQDLLVRAEAFRERNRSCVNAKLLKFEGPAPGFACGTCVAIAGLQRKQELMKKILCSSQDLVPIAWVSLKDILPQEALEQRILLERHKTLEGLARNYLKKVNTVNFEDCEHFKARFLEEKQKDVKAQKSQYIIFSFEQLFIREEHASELKILLQFSNFDPRKWHNSCMPEGLLEENFWEAAAGCYAEAIPFSIPYQVHPHNVMEILFFNGDADLLEILLDSRPGLITQDCRKICSMTSKMRQKSGRLHGNAISTLLEEIRAMLRYSSWRLLDLAIDYGADVNNKANTKYGLAERPPYDEIEEPMYEHYSHHAELINYFIGHGLMDFRNKAEGSAILALLDYFYDPEISDMEYYGIEHVDPIILRFEFLGYQYNGSPMCIQAEERKLRKWKAELPNENHLGNSLYGEGMNRIRMLTQHLGRVKNHPLSLQACARNEIRKALGGSDFCKKLLKLTLPKHLKDFVRVFFPRAYHS